MYCFGLLSNMILTGERRTVEGEDFDCVPHSLISVVLQHKTTSSLLSLAHALTPVFSDELVCLPSSELL